jgi:hypothetical protein
MDADVRGYVVMDLETDGLFKGGECPRITCGCTLRMTRDGPWFVRDNPIAWAPSDLANPVFVDAALAAQLVTYLADQTDAGFVTVGWNAVSFDLRVLHATLADDPETLARLERVVARSIDPMLCLFMSKGYPVSLDAVARGFGLPTKTGSGEDAIDMWLNQGKQGREAVIEYCKNDVLVTSNVLEAISGSKMVKWISKKDATMIWKPTARLLLMHTEITAMLPQPDNGWMDKPILKSEFVGWLEAGYPTLAKADPVDRKRKRQSHKSKR